MHASWRGPRRTEEQPRGSPAGRPPPFRRSRSPRAGERVRPPSRSTTRVLGVISKHIVHSWVPWKEGRRQNVPFLPRGPRVRLRRNAMRMARSMTTAERRMSKSYRISGGRPPPASFSTVIGWFACRGVRIDRVLTDGGAAYLSNAVRAATLRGGPRLIRTRPHRPQTKRQGRMGHSKAASRMGLRRLTRARGGVRAPCGPGSATTTPIGRIPRLVTHHGVSAFRWQHGEQAGRQAQGAAASGCHLTSWRDTTTLDVH